MTATRAAPMRRTAGVARARAADVLQWVRDGLAAEGLERRVVWIVAAIVLVLGPAAFTAARTAEFTSQVSLLPQRVGPFAPDYTPGLYLGFTKAPVFQQRIRALSDAGPSEYDDARAAVRDGVVLLTVRSSSPERAREVADALARTISEGTRGQVLGLRRTTLDQIERRLRTADLTPRQRVRLFRARRQLVGLGPSPPPRATVAGRATTPRLRTWADRLAERLPGDTPGRPSPFWAGFAGLLLLATLWVAAMTLAPPGGQAVALLRRPVPEARPGAHRTGPQVAAPEPREPLRLRWWWRVAWIAALAATPVLTLALIVSHGVNVPYFDEFTLVPLFQAHDTGTLGFDHFWAQHEEHRPVIPRTADYLTALATGWNLKVELYRNFAVAAATFALLLLALRRTLGRVGLLAASVVASVVFFSPVQWENWLWGWQLEWFLANLAAVGAAWAVTFTFERRPHAAVAIAAGCALVATFSLGGGLLLWPIVFAVLVLRRRLWQVWAPLWILVWVVYFSGWANPADQPPKTEVLHEPANYAKFVTLYFGRIFSISDVTGYLVGAGVMVAFVVLALHVLRERRDATLVRRATLWLVLGAYSLGSGLLTGIARVQIPVASSRYATVGGLLALSTLVLFLLVVGRGQVGGRSITPRLRVRLQLAASGVLLLAALINLQHGAADMRTRGDERAAWAGCAQRSATPVNRCIASKRFAPYAETFDWIVYLRRKGWAGFSR